MKLDARVTVGVAVGVGVSVALDLAWAWTFSTVMDRGGDTKSTPYWFTNASTLYYALGPLVPGFVAAWIARKRGVLIGFVVGFVATIAYSIAAVEYWSEVNWSSGTSVGQTLLWLAIHGVSIGLVSAAAGGTAELLRSNNALEQTREG